MLKLRRVRIDTYGENIALVARTCVAFRPGEHLALKRVEVSHDGGRLFATLAITDDEDLVGPDQLGLNEQAFRLLDRPEGTPLAIAPAGGLLPWLRSAGLRIVASTPDGDSRPAQVAFGGPVAIVLGSEERGLDEALLAAADVRVRIPMRGSADSLNVSVSAGVLLYEAVRQRTAG